MKIYNHIISIKLPASLADIAAKVGKALDDDVGGEHNFHRDITGYDGETPIYADTISTSVMCTSDFKAQSDYMMLHPEALFAACQADYATRWPELVPPTLEECERFCAGIILPESLEF